MFLAVVLEFLLCYATACPPNSAENAAEVRTAQEWATMAFARPQAEAETTEVLTVLRRNHKLLANRTVWGGRLRLGERVFEHGIYMDAPAELRVSLAQPAVELVAQVGIDRSQSTLSNPGRGSARFHVKVGNQRIYSTPVLRLADGALTLKVPLKGVRTFNLEVDDGGDGISYDQCDWGEVAVKLQDGSRVRLDELPMRDRTLRSALPISFLYDGRASDDLLPGWEYSQKSTRHDGGTRRVVSFRDPKTSLLLEAEVTTYDDAAAVDWVCYLSNQGEQDTPVIEQLAPLDRTLLDCRPGDLLTLRWSNGDANSADAFLPHDEPLAAGVSKTFAPRGGRSSNGTFPFFNVLGPKGGWIVAIGWTGQWQARFTRHAQGPVMLWAGMQRTHFRLRPGERVRTPRIVLLRYDGPKMARGHNQFRRLMLDHYVVHREGQPAVPPIAHNTAATVYRSKQPATERNQLEIIARAATLGVEAYWLDAYWYPQPWHANVGNWFPRPEDFPRGLKPLGQATHQAGMKFVLWFEPERVRAGTQFDQEHPEFLLRLNANANRLFNLGDEQARRFLVDFLDRRIKEWGIDIYRQDFNFDPLPYWRANDSEDRQGITEMRYVEGLYAFWSELLRCHPGLTIDNCASGGRRIDLETCSRSYPLWRSDRNDIGEGLKGPDYWPQMACADQVHVAGLALYLPFQSGPVWDMHPYSFRSAMTSSIVLYERIVHPDFPAELARQAIAELKELRPLFVGDFYLLTEPTINPREWHAYQLDRPDLGRGCALFFRRPASPYPACDVTLQGIDLDAEYEVSITGETYTPGKPQRMSGRDLCTPPIRIDQKPGSVLLRYCRR